MLRILAIFDDRAAGAALVDPLRASGHEVDCVFHRDALGQVAASRYDLVVVDANLGGAELSALVARLDEGRGARAGAPAATTSADPLAPLVGGAPSMARVRDRIEVVAESTAAVLLTGESGTGKELVAHAIHDAGPRRAGPFVAVNCAAFPDTLLEEELFGHERGAFTGAVRSRIGRFKAAHGGTIFLDEIAELSPAAQAKLLRVLQDHTFEPIGSNAKVTVDVRVISATHSDLRERIASGRFREDLYYRIKVLDIHLPPLREQLDELPLLVDHFLRRARPDAPAALSPRAWAALRGYPFPGNIRELEHAIQHAVVLSRGGAIDLEHLPAEIAGAEASSQGGGAPCSLGAAMKEFEREYLARALQRSGGAKALTAELLGISRKSLWEKLREHGLSVGRAPTVPPEESGESGD